ncbi:hypothetical protein MHZ90_06815 [Pantoea sp. ACRSH]|uniref:hypothetical protein n=1 Tax=unclassified Pantoea TaxID=2630326 RepID=UPI001EF6666B|nr:MULTISPECIES: hypothetical protein [unclassified Pantoea]MCG7365851.1 hypothetical protein [Pantoea sp. ACRSH]MCG7396479.1 hypothetical protein [Pantoea sp. ACRSC]
MAWPDRKVALRIPARSARDFPVAGRFAPRAMPSAFQLLCGFLQDERCLLLFAFQLLCGFFSGRELFVAIGVSTFWRFFAGRGWLVAIGVRADIRSIKKGWQSQPLHR